MSSERGAETSNSNHACTECKIKKIRCIRSTDAAVSCDRCSRLGKGCQIPEKRKRAPKNRVRHRLEQLEDHYGQILSLLSAKPHSPSSTTTPPATSARRKDSRSSSSDQNFSPIEVQPHDTSLPEHGVISNEDGNILLDTYRQISKARFPYVLISKSLTFESMRVERPMLLLAILTVFSSRDEERQAILHKKLLNQLGERLFVQAEKSLDLLQALLVYTAWSHLYTNATQGPSYRYASLAISMALDLGLHKKPISTTQHEMILNGSSNCSSSVTQPQVLPLPSKSWSLEARRAFVGAYELSYFCTMLYRTPSALSFTAYLEDCALSLSKESQYPSDTRIIHRIRVIRIAAEIFDTFEHGNRVTEAEMSDERIFMLVKSFERQLSQWRSTLQAPVLEDVELTGFYHATLAFAQEVSLYGILQGQIPSPTRISIMFDCISNMRAYISNILTLTLDEMAGWTALNWRCLNYAIMLGTRVSLILHSASPSLESTAKMETIGLYLDELISRIKIIHNMSRGPGKSCVFFQHMTEAWEKTRGWVRLVKQKSANQTSGSSAAVQGVQAEDHPSLSPSISMTQMQWPQGQMNLPMPWTGFDGAEMWVPDEAWLRMEFGAPNFGAPTYETTLETS